ncbi:MAG: hypothetical protein AB7F32_01090 [Victivallaceae bacterium]
MRFRQIHLDFHTSGLIPDIGKDFDKKEFQRTLKEAAVDSITCFSSCHHGWSYHPTRVGEMHPGLKFDLLRAQLDACLEIDVKVPVYLTAGVNELMGKRHPEWREIAADGGYGGWTRSPLSPGFPTMCFNTPYLDWLCRQIEETVTLFPDADGIFLDIIAQGECCCRACLEGMLERKLDPTRSADRKLYSELVLDRYYQKTTAAARSRDPQMRVFHNSGHISPAWGAKLKYFSHLELESLPTGGWGYDHFPQSAAFARKTGLDFLGMTGKFHSSWGEFGGFKHPNALRYECAAMIAQGARCSVGDQLHPSGRLDESTYRIIGEAYREVAAKEPFCVNAVNLADIGVIPQEAFAAGDGKENCSDGDTGVTRLLLEGQFTFDVLAPTMDFGAYKMLILPDTIEVGPDLREKLAKYLASGGKLVLSGKSGTDAGFDLGGVFAGESEFDPSYILPAPEFAPEFCNSPFVVYGRAQNFKVTTGKSLGAVFDPYFNRDYRHFSSHQHTPNRPEPSDYSAGAICGNITCFAHPVFTVYRRSGAVAFRQFVTKVLRAALGQEILFTSNLPSLARVTVTQDTKAGRAIVHLLYGNIVKRGGGVPGSPFLTREVELIEELLPLHDIKCSLRVDRPVKSVKLEPQGLPIDFAVRDGRCEFTVDQFTCHQMVSIEYQR